jgi:hypothetical protein
VSVGKVWKKANGLLRPASALLETLQDQAGLCGNTQEVCIGGKLLQRLVANAGRSFGIAGAQPRLRPIEDFALSLRIGNGPVPWQSNECGSSTQDKLRCQCCDSME